MYLDFFNLNQHPFQIAPDYHFLYLSRQHARAMAYMKYTVVNHEGFAVISGEIGSGKTTLVQKFLAETDRNVTVVRITQSMLNAIEFLQTVARGLASKAQANDKVALHNEIRQLLEQQRKKQRNVLLLVDDAQNLDDAVLEEIRLLADSEVEHGGTLSIILVGQPELEQRLKQPTLRQLDQRVRLRFRLGPLSEEETELYIQYRMKLAGRDGLPLFEPDVCYAIYRYTRGVPRLINILCDSILLNAFVENEQQLSVKLAEAAAMELEWEIPHPQATPSRRLPQSRTNAPVEAIMKAPVSMLEVSTKDGFIEGFPITKPVIRIGRTSVNDLQLAHPSVDEIHAMVVDAGGEYYLVDLESTNSTFIDTRPIIRERLVDGTIFRIAEYYIKFLALPPIEANLPEPSGDLFETNQKPEAEELSDDDSQPSAVVSH